MLYEDTEGDRDQVGVLTQQNTVPTLNDSSPSLGVYPSGRRGFREFADFINKDFVNSTSTLSARSLATNTPEAPPLGPSRTTSPDYPIPQFEKFFKLPIEVRKRVYEFALCTGQEIRPILCDGPRGNSIKFHDETKHSRVKPNHGAVYKLLGVTLASRQVREESLPCFYSANTFAIGMDTATYFAHLQELGRFHLIRHVRLYIPRLTEQSATQLLVQMDRYVKDVDKYDRQHTSEAGQVAHVAGKRSNMPLSDQYTSLIKHPRYIAGGLNDMILFICLRMLTSAFSGSNSGGYTSSLTLPVPSIKSFTSEERLRWFPSMCHGLGIHLRYVDKHELVGNHKHCVVVDWHQKFQKKEFTAEEGAQVDVDVRQRTLEMFPEVDKRAVKWDSHLYMRKTCCGGAINWYKVMHCGGAESGRVN